MAIRMKTVVQLKAEGEAASHSRIDVDTGGLSLTIDEPEARGGTNMGPTPTSTAIAALVGCTNVIGHKVADKLGIELSAMHVDAVADFDRRGVTLSEEIDVPFPAITLNVQVDTAAPQADIDRLAHEVAKYCPISKVFRQAGTEIKEEWTIRNRDTAAT